MEIPLLKEILILFSVSVLLLLILNRVKIPSVVGYLLAGIIVGPFALGFVKESHQIEVLAEIGIILLLFSIGIEFSLKTLLKVKSMIFIGGTLQILLTTAAIMGIAMFFGALAKEAAFIGLLVSLSSTAIVLKVIQDNGTVDTPRGRISLAMLILQDIAIVPLMIFIPLVAGEETTSSAPIWWQIIRVLLVIVIVFVSARYLVPKLLYRVARTRNNEIFLLAVLVLAFSVAWLTSLTGVSLALGAFLAGMVISESEYNHHTIGNILPLILVFTSFFFLSVGMLLDIRYLFDHFGLILLLTIIVIVTKSIMAFLPVVWLGYPARIAWASALTISQVGEFSFILSKLGRDLSILSPERYQLFLSVSVLSMSTAPLFIKNANKLSDLLMLLPWPEKWVTGRKSSAIKEKIDLEGHMVIVGFGLNGANIANIADELSIPTVIIEMNPETVRREQLKGRKIYLGDATQLSTLELSSIEHARVLVLTIPHRGGNRRIAEMTRQLNPHITIIVRARYLSETPPLKLKGANIVVTEEFETSVELLRQVMLKYDIDDDTIAFKVNQLRHSSLKAGHESEPTIHEVE